MLQMLHCSVQVTACRAKSQQDIALLHHLSFAPTVHASCSLQPQHKARSLLEHQAGASLSA